VVNSVDNGPFVVRFSPQVTPADRDEMRRQLRLAGVDAQGGLDLGDRGPLRQAAALAVIVLGTDFASTVGQAASAADVTLAGIARRAAEWLVRRGGDQSGGLVEIVDPTTGITIRISGADPQHAAELLPHAVRTLRADQPLAWQGEGWAPARNEEPTQRTTVMITTFGTETIAVSEHLDEAPQDRWQQERRGTLYEIGTFTGDHSAWTVSIVEVGPGNSTAGIELDRAMSAFSPAVIMLVGVAGALKDLRHGDVVAADSVYDYESAKDVEEGLLPRIKTHSPSYRLIQQARMVARHSRWQQRIKPHTPQSSPRAVIKPIAAGGKLVADAQSQTANLLRKNCGDAVAVEMEGYGFLRGAYLNPQADVLVVRGISDLLSDKDQDNDDRWQPIAARHAAAFAYTVLDEFGRTRKTPPS